MVSLAVNIRPAEPIKIAGVVRQFDRNLRWGLNKAGSIVLQRWQRNISGAGYVRNPARSKPYPGVLTGQYFRTLTSRPDGNDAQRVGPNVNYAHYHETGTSRMPARPVRKPTWKQVGDEAVEAIREAIMRPVY